MRLVPICHTTGKMEKVGMKKPDRFDTSFVDAETVAVQREHRLRLEMLCRGEQPEIVPAFAACTWRTPIAGAYDCDAWLTQALAEMRGMAAAFRDRVTYRPFALSLALHDLHFPAALAGCPVHQNDGRIWWTPLSKLGAGIEDFRAPDLDRHPGFQEMIRQLRLIVEATNGRIPVEIPYVSEPLLLAVDLFGEEFLMLLAAEPGLADRFLDKLTAFILDMRLRFLKAAADAPLMPHGSCGRPMPERYNLLYECTTQLISGDAYKGHLLERDRNLMRCGSPGAGIHLCGRHTQHIRAWRDAPELKMIQLNDHAADDLEIFWRSLRPDQYIVLMPGERVTKEHALLVTGGRRLVLAAELDEAVPIT